MAKEYKGIEDLEISNTVLIDVFMKAPVAICALRGNDFIIQFANDFYLQILGKDKSIIGSPLFASSPELLNQGLKELLINILNTGEEFQITNHEVKIFRNNKIEPCFFNCLYKPIKESNNKIIGIIITSTEVTDQVKSKEQADKNEWHYTEILMQSPFAFALLTGAEMLINSANDSIKKIWGKGNDVEGKTIFQVLPEIIDQGFPELLNKVFTTGVPYSVAENLVYLIRNGKKEKTHFNFVYQPYREINGTISGVVIFAYEVTSEVNLHHAIAESEIKFRLIADSMPAKVSYHDFDGSTTYLNEKWIDYSAQSLEELIKYGWGKIIHPDDFKIAERIWETALKEGTDFEMELRLLNKNGEYNWHLSKLKALKDKDGKIEHWIGVNTEIQKQKEESEVLDKSLLLRTAELIEANDSLIQKNNEVEETQEKLLSEYSRSLIEASLDPLVTISIFGKIMDMNVAMLNVTEISREKLRGTDFKDYFTDAEKARKGYQEVFDKGYVVNYPLTIKDGKLTDVLFNGSVFKDSKGNVLGAVVVARDISDQKRIEKELIEARQYAEIATAIAEGEKLKAEYAAHISEDSVKAKQQFLSNMSHEIRTPMNAIIGFTKVILKTDLSVKQREYLTAIKISGDALIVLINDILDLAKVDAGKMTFEQIPFKLSQSISAMLHLFESKIHEKNLELEKEYDNTIPEVLLGDPIRLHQIILNLVSNALKFTTKGKITVRVKMLKLDNEKVTIQFSVTDTGIGIEKEKIAKIFENFQQASSSTSRLYGGTGLGLAIVKQLVEPQGGVIVVESEVGKGSTFSFTLDFMRTDEIVELEDTIMEIDKDLKNIKVLVAEDMSLNQLLMKTLLDEFGFERDIADNGRIAIKKLEQGSYDIVLMDLQMPEMNGFEATEYIRNTMKSNIPIIALTADVTTADLAKCKSVGMNDYIAKPVDERLLYRKIVNLVNQLPKEENVIDNNVIVNQIVKLQCTDLTYLNNKTKSNPESMMEMITAYLEQTPPLISAIKKSLSEKDWPLLYSSMHKIIPSFSIMGMSQDLEIISRQIQDYANTQLLSENINDLVLKLETVCHQACEELKVEYQRIKNLKPL